jgi:LacI family transcriptional regulator
MLAGLQNVLEKNGFAVIHNTSEYDIDEEYRQALTLVERGVEAIVLVGTRHRTKTFELISDHRITLVVTYAIQENFRFTSIGFDNYGAAAVAANKLYDLGHRCFGMLAGITTNNDRAQGRVDGFIETLIAKGIERRKIILRESRYQIGEGRAAMASLLSEDPTVTALFCGSDVLAVGALYECRQRAIAVPHDMSIIGFDNLEISAYTDPPLTTLNVPAYEMGSETGQYIIRSEPGAAPTRKIEMHIELVERGTMARAPDQLKTISRSRAGRR